MAAKPPRRKKNLQAKNKNLVGRNPFIENKKQKQSGAKRVHLRKKLNEKKYTAEIFLLIQKWIDFLADQMIKAYTTLKSVKKVRV